MLNQLKLGSKFTLLLSIVLTIGILLSGLASWFRIQPEAEEDVAQRAEMLTQTMNSVRSYTSNHISPLLKEKLLTEQEFVRETVPAFSARAVFEQFRNRPEYSSFFYKEASPNPTNPQDLADEFEAELVAKFRIEPNLANQAGYRTIEGKRLYYIARPLAIQEVSCLQCHSTPQRAPKSQIATYGSKAGFGWRLNDMIAAQVVYVPADEVFEHGRENLMWIMGIFSFVLAIAILSINFLLKHAVVRPIKQLTAIARHLSNNSLTPEQLKEFETPAIAKVARRRDEPGQLARTFQHMAQEVSERETKLNQAVEERTAQLAERTKEAQAANTAKSQFLATMSHELRTPLNIILGFSQIMTRQRSLDKTQQEYINTINRSGEHLLGLINNVLDLAKIEAGKITLNETNFDLDGMLNWLQTLFQFKAKTKGIQFVIERASTLPNQIQTDEGKLRQVLVNLIGNAVKFTQTGQIILRVRSNHANELQFEIADTGVGIAPTELAQLFQPFVQTESGRKTQEGTGLGLAIAQQFVQLMGGTLTAQSQVGVGTTFRFSIHAPFIEAPSHQNQPIQQVTGLAPGQPIYRILIADDISENRRILVELLKPLGFEVREATNGQAAIDVAQTWLPHLIWMDLRMPDIDGYEATQRIKAFVKPVPIVIAITGSAFEEDRKVALEIGCDDFVRKPFRAETIFEKMAAYLGVRYTYALESVSSLEAQPSIASEFPTAVDLTVMPLEWIEQLQQAATRVNAKQILKLIDEIPSEQEQLIHTLTNLVNHFRFSELVELTRSHLN
jgi:signal transduction histidine kinase/DNA-binding response OmpR family regulator